jgi:hypothetical protein
MLTTQSDGPTAQGQIQSTIFNVFTALFAFVTLLVAVLQYWKRYQAVLVTTPQDLNNEQGVLIPDALVLEYKVLCQSKYQQEYLFAS